MEAPRSALIIGAGIGGLGSACLLAKVGWKVTVLEKNKQLGGRAGYFEAEGFRFDSGPSWYLMPDVFEHFFDLLGEDVNKLLKLQKLSPSYRVYYKGRNHIVDIYSELSKDLETIEKLEPDAGKQLQRYLEQASRNYAITKDQFMYKNYDSIKDFLTTEMLTEGRKLKVLSSIDRYMRSFFKTEELRQLLQYPVVFLGSRPEKTPALFSIMNHIDFSMGVHYPRGGIYEIVRVLEKIASKHGAKFQLNNPVNQILVKHGQAVGVEMADGTELTADVVISNADIHHTETKLLAPQYRTKTDRYWETRTLAPSALLIYLGVKGSLSSLSHHNLVFSRRWKQNFKDIFELKQWPGDPSFYVCCPSKTDSSVAPKGHENLFVLVPIAHGLDYSKNQLEKYADMVLATMESEMGLKGLRQKIVYKKLVCAKDFAERYNSYQGSALGLAHTLRQTAVFRPSNINKKVRNLYYVGAGTNPGIGIPPALISAELVYKRLIGNKTDGPLSSL